MANFVSPFEKWGIPTLMTLVYTLCQNDCYLTKMIWPVQNNFGQGIRNIFGNLDVTELSKDCLCK